MTHKSAGMALAPACTTALSRREALRAAFWVGVFGLEGSAIASTRSRPKSPADVYRAAVGRLAAAIMGAYFRDLVAGSDCVATPAIAADFHDRFAPPFVLVGATIPPFLSKHGYWITIERVPRADLVRTIGPQRDLNLTEIEALMHRFESGNSPFVLCPAGPRMPPDRRSGVAFRNACKARGLDPDAWILDYTRLLSDGKFTDMGFGVTARSAPDCHELIVAPGLLGP